MKSSLHLLYKYTIILFLIFFCTSSWAQRALQVTGISNASNHDLGSATVTPIIYGGVTGLISGGATCAAGTGTSTTLCNNCTTNDVACNRRRIHPSTLLRIEFKVIAEMTTPGYIFVGYENGGTIQSLALTTEYLRSTAGTLTKDSTGYVEIYWGALCDKMLADGGTCEDPAGEVSTSNTIYISVEPTQSFTAANTLNINLQILNPGFDPLLTDNSLLVCTDNPDSAGICSFKASPGDEKISIINDIEVANTCPTTFVKTRFYYSTASFTDATYTSENYTDLAMGAGCEPSDVWNITGLENGVPYYVRASVLDKANNNVFLTDITGQINVTDNCAANDDTDCRFIATPGNVVGLLPEDLNCFIATAAFGSAFSAKVKTLRAFRNQFLLTNNIGRELTKFYYEYGPSGAKFISDKPALRAITRLLLTPPWALAWLSIHYGLSGALLIIFSMLGFIIYGVRELRRGKM